MVPANRRAFSLIEVLLATSILMGSLIVLEELARLGRRHAIDADETATAQVLARAKLSEILAGAAPLKSIEAEPVAEPPGWVCTVAVEPSTAFGMTQVAVTVAKGDAVQLGPVLSTGSRPNGGSAKNGARPGRSFTLIQWVRALKRGEPSGPSGRPSTDLGRRFAARGGR